MEVRSSQSQQDEAAMAARTMYTLPTTWERGWVGRQGGRLRGVDSTQPAVWLGVAPGWPATHRASCPSVPSTCLDLIYLPKLYDRPLRLLHSHPCEVAILPLHRTSQASCPSPDSTTGKPTCRPACAARRPDSQQTFNPPPLSLDLHRLSVPLPSASDRHISQCRPDHRRSHPLFLLDSPRRLPPQVANTPGPNPSGLHRNSPSASTRLRRNPRAGPPATLDKYRLPRTTTGSTKNKDKHGTGTRRCVTFTVHPLRHHIDTK